MGSRNSAGIRSLGALAAVCAAAAAIGLAPTAPIRADEPSAKSEPMSYWMKKKLEYSQNTLAAIATADFDRIVQNANAMRNLSKVEGFIRGQTPGYREELQMFDKAAVEIARQAQRENVEGAALAFTQLTISCVNCHKTLRPAK